MSSDSDANWVEVVGYRHEVVHTGVLRQLLSIPDGVGADVAEAFFGLEAKSVARDGCCFDDGGPTTEVKIGQTRERADLGGWLRLSDGARTWALVETKVDSAGTRAQLDATARNSDVSVLFAVGCSALARSAGDLQRDVAAELLSLPPVDRPNQHPAPFASGAREWIVHTPASWLDIIAPHAAAASWLPPYAEAVREQIDAHTGARLSSEQGWDSAAMRGRSWRAKLHRMALAAAVREGLSQLPLPGSSVPGLGHWNAEIFNDADTRVCRCSPPGGVGRTNTRFSYSSVSESMPSCACQPAAARPTYGSPTKRLTTRSSRTLDCCVDSAGPATATLRPSPPGMCRRSRRAVWPRQSRWLPTPSMARFAPSARSRPCSG